MRNQNSNFGRDGLYTCARCRRRTRETGEGESSVGLCAICYEICGIENTISDYGDPDGKLQLRIFKLKNLQLKCEKARKNLRKES